MFKALGASPTSRQLQRGLFARCRPKIVDGQENPLPIIQTAKLYEVQKYCALTNHIWDGFWFLANGSAWEALPADLRDDRRDAINAAGMKQREDIAELNASRAGGPRRRKGLAFNQPTTGQLPRQAAEAGFYGEWKGKFGDEAWALLEKYVGKLA